MADGYIRIVDRKKGLMVLDTGKNVPSNKIESKFALCKWVDTVVPIGSERKFVSALVIPNLDVLTDLFDKEKISYNRDKVIRVTDPVPAVVEVGEDFIQHPRLKELIDRDIQKINKELDDYEMIKKYTILSRRLTIQDGDMTPTLKVKRKFVIDKYKDVIDKMYT